MQFQHENSKKKHSNETKEQLEEDLIQNTSFPRKAKLESTSEDSSSRLRYRANFTSASPDIFQVVKVQSPTKNKSNNKVPKLHIAQDWSVYVQWKPRSDELGGPFLGWGTHPCNCTPKWLNMLTRKKVNSHMCASHEKKKRKRECHDS